ncbi:hypothetical protein COT40_01715 [Candidatus Peregrinibacteria bacterium CG08_land_8_20_14_0_20_41_10]|nr:MAG: hypothetical protein COT40_01715 [Candidatus Peregrinibacteria bacterium CG08_land_8_20_14_0_20_41_10]
MFLYAWKSSSRVNQTIRKQRHQRIKVFQLHQKERLKNPFDWQAKKQRLLCFLSRETWAYCFVLVFVISALSPNLIAYSSVDNVLTSDQSYEKIVDQLDQKNTLNTISEDGFLTKPFLSSSENSRKHLSDVMEYTVRPGDTLSTIAYRFGISVSTLTAVNEISNQNRLKIGQKLLVLPVDGLLYVAQKDDTLDTIAKKFQVSKTLITEQNRLEGKIISTGLALIIPGAKKINLRVASKTTSSRVASVSLPPQTTKKQAVSFTPALDKNFAWPVYRGTITQQFSRYHPALDISSQKGKATGIYAAMAGRVIKVASGWNGGYGNMIMIDHGNGIKTLYAHLSSFFVKTDDYVSQGQLIAHMGNSGRVYGKTGIHLHFEIINNGKKTNPLSSL